jgi:hypothetical protein
LFPNRISCEDGVATYQLPTWPDFHQFLDRVFPDRGRASHRFIWRGQSRSDWPLDSALDRLFDRVGLSGSGTEALEKLSQTHLENFKYAARGRRGLNPRTDLTENEWWALGQHFGLATPLLDWSHSPFAAAYFAFEEHDDGSGTPFRVVFGLNRDAVQAVNDRIIEAETGDKRPAVLEFIEPLSDENPRLVSQGAMFTRAPVGVPVEVWVQRAFARSDSEVLLRVELPKNERTRCLRSLERMNINHLSLFPDLTGASRATNLRTEMDLSS